MLTYLITVVYILLFKDINECNELHPCDKFAECVNTEPGYRCDCMDGYHSNGHDSCSGKTVAISCSVTNRQQGSLHLEVV